MASGGRNDIVVNIKTRFDAVEAESRRLHKQAHDAGANFSEEFARGLNSHAPSIQRSLSKSVDYISRQTEAIESLNRHRERQTKIADAVVAAEDEYNRILQDGTTSVDERSAAERHLLELRLLLNKEMSVGVREQEKVARANRNLADSINNVVKAQDKLREESSGGQTLLTAGKFISALRSAFIPVTTIGAVTTLSQLVAVAAAASQSLWMLPAAAAAAGAGIGTLAIATSGFGDALKDMGDPEKFAEALQKLSPNAQQAALAIQAIMPELTKLKKATQDAFFAGGADMINRLTNQYLPTIQKFTTGVAAAFNQAGRELFNQLMTPEMQDTLKGLLNDVEQAFRNLAPAAAPFAKAIADIVAAGANFLPSIANAATRAAESFADFIGNARDSGQLAKWFDDGIDAISQVWDGIKGIGKAFANLAPAGQKYLPDIVRFLKVMEETLPKLIKLAGDLAPPFEAIARIIQAIEKAVSLISKANPLNLFKTIFNNSRDLGLFGNNAVVLPANTPGSGTYTPPASPSGPIPSTSGSNVPDILNSILGGPSIPANSGSNVPDILNGILGGSGSITSPIQIPGASPVDTAGLPGVPAGGYPVPAPPPDKSAAAAWEPPVFDPSLWQVPDGLVPINALPGGMASPSGLQPNASALNDIVSSLFPMMPSAGGWRPPDGFNEHSAGEAVDFMTGGDFALGDAINAFILQNAEALGVQYTIWRQMMHYADGRTSLMEDRGSPTQNHMDHIHARVKPGPATAGALAFPGAGAGAAAAGMMGGYVVDPEAVMRAESARLTAKNDLEQKRLRLLELEAKGDATQRELLTAKNDVAEATRRYDLAVLDEQQARQGKYKQLDSQISKTADGIGQVGAALAGDFGISEGLPGIAKWLTTFLANLAFAPAIGALSAVKATSPIQGGYGMMGMMGANAMATGTYPGMGAPAVGGLPFMPPMVPGAAAIGPAPLGGGVGPGLVPGLATPAMPGVAGPVGGGLGGGIPGVGPFGMVPGALGGGLGGGMQIGGAAQGTAQTSRSPAPGSGGGFQGFGGSGIGALAMQGMQAGLSAAGMAADVMGAGGAGTLGAQAAQTGIELANRFSGYLGQLAGIGVSGLLETFLPNNSAAADPSKSWFGRIASGLSGARPALPNTAGSPAPAQQPKQPGQPGQGGGNAPLIGAINNYTPDSGQTIAKEVERLKIAGNARAMATG